ncbi:hypothetical protein BD310DRAFT_919461 [Dichomitus squalens]|uniref:F-box domain-containing protein n=1 Tax=Dichomitus squalens TaxID=114155 RepID=A0A4Q9Q5Z6_9APHY|nr:hypothetical protein BD310DRAFT_919461 [Dichomitus squalens]
MASFLQLPTELRLHIYDHVLADHQHVRKKLQPSNAHFRLLHTCRQIAEEAGTTFHRYVSLLHEHQIHAFVLYAAPSLLSRIEWADVANDGRVFHLPKQDQADAAPDTPLSSLHIALGRMTSLRRLRVFPCRQGLPLNLQNTMSLHRSRRLGLSFERAMFPTRPARLAAYELYLNPDTRVDIFDAVLPDSAVALRFSGEIVARPEAHDAVRMPCLRHVTLHGVTGSYFDRHTVDRCFPDAHLESFTYALGHRLGFEIRNHHLESLAASYGPRLRKLVLLGCSRLSSTVITQCLENLPALEYFALHLVTVDELRSNFVNALPPCLATFKLQVINAWYAVALKDEERALCDSIESVVLLRDMPLQHVCICFRAQIMAEGAREQRWARIAKDRMINLQLGPWEDRMIENM